MKKPFLLWASAFCFTVNQPAIINAQTKNILLEEFTGALCGYCPMGSYTLDTLLKTYPNLIGVSLHSFIPGDAMHFLELDTVETPYGQGAPLGTIDRINFNDGWNFVAKEYPNWNTHVQTRLTEQPKLLVSLNSAWNPITRNISTQITANILTNMPAGDYRFSLYVAEDSVIGSGWNYDQANLFNSATGNPFYGKGDPISGFIHRHVVRAILPTSWGQPGIIASTPAIGQNFSTTINYTLPADYNENRIKLVAFVSGYSADHLGDEVFNAAEINLPLQMAIQENKIIKNITAYPNPFSLQTALQTDHFLQNATLTVQNCIGQKVAEIKNIKGKTIAFQRNNLPCGMYFFLLTEDCKIIASNKLFIID